MENKHVTIYQEEAKALENAKIEMLASGFQFTEGPLWHPDGYLLFSDTPANNIYSLIPGEKPQVFLEKSGFTGDDRSMLSDQLGSNALAFDCNNNMVICQHGNHAIAILKEDTIEPVAASFDGRPFNSPNDVVCGPDRAIYFTDPPYGLKEQILHPSVFQTKAGVYRYYEGETVLLASDLRYPNGICFSPSGEYMYVGSNHPDEPIIWEYSIHEGRILNQSILIEQNADGIKTDNEGNLWMGTNEGILVVSQKGLKRALIPLAETPTNLAWAGNNYSELYVTARSAIFRISNLS
jgi:gluconolactonase